MIATTQRERVLPRLIEEEMRESFLDYSMSVIVQRALPDVRRPQARPSSAAHSRILRNQSGGVVNRDFRSGVDRL
ncbi:MAG TPA: hypothetical protein VM890_09945 [Longimicrobium sp.]|jgi:hypothetical protein|nr:hypothetical protein [Longimicrobium sp.]